LIVWVRALMAEDLASLNIRSISTGPSPAFALLYNVSGKVIKSKSKIERY